jgi:DinB superfamily
MKCLISVTSAVVLCAATTFAQPPAGQKIDLATSLQRGYAGIKANFTAAAEKMPDADYMFKPGSTPEARTYAAVIAHIAQSQFGQCSGLIGVPNPEQGKNLEKELTTKAAVVKALADSYALCDKAFAMVTDANATEMVKAGQNEQTRAAALYGVIVHGNEMAGTAYVYLRSKNIVPPSTERAMGGMRGRGNF